MPSKTHPQILTQKNKTMKCQSMSHEVPLCVDNSFGNDSKDIELHKILDKYVIRCSFEKVNEIKKT